jgi:hypothetical protein
VGYDIVTLETQNHGQDWPLIVTAIECPTCGAEKGEMCHAVGAANPMAVTGQPRIDWHAARKQNAAAAWYTRHEVAQISAPPPPPAPEAKQVEQSKATTFAAPPPPPPPPPSK